ncbi:hypothetical protein SAMN04488057_102330 [Cyclobacterium lianum]|uniref:Uncharacterized protein n=1 Tax=Cyclobacterium lianum TaxID=388280 RepID=A0A1M7K8P0_9BACT|nr:hypothetical protein [Cyclobacterium lianum]SHM61217.1 hypothetical protein SAMN04488057_102330 [Cyclobacterium lianum]
MLKYTYETAERELKTWVDPENGSLNIQIGNETVNIPHQIGAEMVGVIRQKQTIFQEIERKKNSSWSKFMESLSGQKSENNGYHATLKDRKYKAA